MKYLLYTFSLMLLLTSCSEYQKAIKSEDIAVKTAVATKKYEIGKYNKAIRLFEQIAPSVKGNPAAENLFYMFSQSYYKTKQYYLSNYYFENFATMYPKSTKVEEAFFLSAKSFSMLSPEYSLDQVDTFKAIDKLQKFINAYPESKYLSEANSIVKEFQEKLEKKDFEIAKQYNLVSDYKPAIKAMDIFLSEHPGTIYKEEALFHKLNACYQLAINSVPSKMEERLYAAKTAQSELIQFNPNTEFKKEANNMLVHIEKELKQFSK